MKDNSAHWMKNIQNKAVLCFLSTYQSHCVCHNLYMVCIVQSLQSQGGDGKVRDGKEYFARHISLLCFAIHQCMLT